MSETIGPEVLPLLLMQKN
uniref:Uncharacterized protein n=1 Tax=Rhizophora mucronata TaxID=61149 RepID=A0A2P2P276_RHIMU